MKRFSVQIDCENAAFDDGDGGRAEIARILKAIADKLENGSQDTAGAYDANGNRVGQWCIYDADCCRSA